MDMFSRIVARTETLAPSGMVCCAFSGGADSTILLRALSESRVAGRLVAVHADHGLDAESGRRAEFALDSARAMGVRFESLDVSGECSRLMGEGHTMEASARMARYSAFRDAFPSASFATGHHADDQAETMLFRLGRGAGMHGASCMRPVSNIFGVRVIRPLLSLRSSEIREALSHAGVGWQEDPSNSDPEAATRNFVRGELIPLAETRIPGFAKNLAAASELFAESSDILREVGEADLSACLFPGEESVLDLRAVRRLSHGRLGNMFSIMPSHFGMHPSPSRSQIENARKQVSAASPAGGTFTLGGLLISMAPGWRAAITPRNPPNPAHGGRQNRTFPPTGI